MSAQWNQGMWSVKWNWDCLVGFKWNLSSDYKHAFYCMRLTVFCRWSLTVPNEYAHFLSIFTANLILFNDQVEARNGMNDNWNAHKKVAAAREWTRENSWILIKNYDKERNRQFSAFVTLHVNSGNRMQKQYFGDERPTNWQFMLLSYDNKNKSQ